MILLAFAALLVVFVLLPLFGWALWTILSAIVVGLIFGGLGRLVVPGRQPIGLLATALLGLAGSLLGTIIGHAAHLHHLATVLVEIGAAAALVGVFSGPRGRQLRSRRRANLLP